jgi:hypothetical protein
VPPVSLGVRLCSEVPKEGLRAESYRRAVKRMITLDTKVVASKGQVSCDLAGEAAILNLKNGVYYGLDAVGACIWNLVQEPKTFAELRDKMLEQYEVEANRLEPDLRALLDQLAEQGLIEITG